MENEKTTPAILPTWLTEKVVHILWIASFGILMIISFCVLIPVALTMGETDGYCLLYAGIHGYGPVSVCSYCVAISVIFLCVCGFRMILLILKLTRYSSHVEIIGTWFSVWGVHIAVLVFDVLLILHLLVTSCLLSAGLSALCQDLFHGREWCSRSAIDLLNGKRTTGFYQSLSVAEGSSWFILVYWLIVVVMETVLLWKNGSLTRVAGKVRSLFN